MRFFEVLENVFDRLLSMLMGLACIILSLVTLSVCLEVVLRYFFDRPQVWVVELSEYALLYITFLGAAWVLKSNGHVTVDLFFTLMKPKGRTVCSLISAVICLTVSAILLVYGSRVTWDYFSKGLYNPTILEFPTSAILLVIPLGGLTLLLQSVRGVVKVLQDFSRQVG